MVTTQPTSTKNSWLGKVKTFDALHHYRAFRFLLSSNLLSSVATWMQTLVMTWLAYDVSKSALLVALFTAARLSPTLLAPFAGSLADIIDRKKLVMLVRSGQAIFSIILATLVLSGDIQFWHLVVLAFVQGVFLSPSMPASQALALDIVGQKDITNAIALSSIVMDVTGVAGAAVRGVVMALAGLANCLWIAAAISLISAGVMLPMERPSITTTVRQESVLHSLAEGFRYVIHNRKMLLVLSVSFSANVFLWPAYQAFIPVFAKDNLGQGPMGLGFLQSASGGGALIGAIIVASLGNFQWKGKMFLFGTLFNAIFFGAFALSHSFPLALLLFGLSGLFSTGFGTMQSTLMLVLAPPDMRARAIGFLQLAIGIYAFGSIAIGFVANVIGAGLATGISCGILAVVILALTISSPTLRRL